MKKKISIYIGSILIALILFIGLCNVYVYEKGSTYIIHAVKDAPPSQVVIILGAAVLKNGTLSPVLQDRVNAAINLYTKGKVSKILITGNNSTLDDDEVSPVRRYLVKIGIPPEDIFVDHAGFDTFSSMYRARDVFQIKSAIIVTQFFHLPRSMFLARSLGIAAYGLPADNGSYSISNYIRELFSRPKALIDIMINRKPKFTGQPFPITGDGKLTWQ